MLNSSEHILKAQRRLDAIQTARELLQGLQKTPPVVRGSVAHPRDPGELTVALRRFKKFVRSLLPASRWIWRLCTDPQVNCDYYPESKSKSKFGIALDNLSWLLRRQEANEYYYAYGFHVRPLRDHWSYAGQVVCRLKNLGQLSTFKW